MNDGSALAAASVGEGFYTEIAVGAIFLAWGSFRLRKACAISNVARRPLVDASSASDVEPHVRRARKNQLQQARSARLHRL